MYSGFTLTDFSGTIIGAHQKIDRAARKHLEILTNNKNLFPSSRQILKFEGKNGPDGLKRKSPGKNEPGHYYDPFGSDQELLKLISQHYDNLVIELKASNVERVSFEAAWLAHSIVDGLTPAHHYPYKQELSELLGNFSDSDPSSVKEKIIMPGRNFRHKLKNNWKFWGPKGLMLNHGLFELGAAVTLAPLSFDKFVPTDKEVELAKEIGIIEYFKNIAKEVGVLDIYRLYSRRGWTPKVIRLTRNKLGPAMVNTVTIAWYLALIDAGLVKSR